MAPNGHVIGLEHYQSLVDKSLSNIETDTTAKQALAEGRLQIIKSDGRLGYSSKGKNLFGP